MQNDQSPNQLTKGDRDLLREFLDSNTGKKVLWQLVSLETNEVIQAESAESTDKQVKHFNRFSGIKAARDYLVRASRPLPEKKK